MADQNLTELVFVLDRSGSMHGLEADTVGGYNALLARNRELPGEALVSCVLFNHESRVLHDRVPIARVQPMGLADFQPSGCTALLDAVGGAIHHHELVQRVLPEPYRPAHTLLAIATDGMENASKKYTYEQVRRMIGDARERGWEVVFLAANIDAAAEAARLGVDADRAVAYAATPSGTREMFDQVACASACVRSGAPLTGWSSRRSTKK